MAQRRSGQRWRRRQLAPVNRGSRAAQATRRWGTVRVDTHILTGGCRNAGHGRTPRRWGTVRSIPTSSLAAAETPGMGERRGGGARSGRCPHPHWRLPERRAWASGAAVGHGPVDAHVLTGGCRNAGHVRTPRRWGTVRSIPTSSLAAAGTPGMGERRGGGARSGRYPRLSRWRPEHRGVSDGGDCLLPATNPARQGSERMKCTRAVPRRRREVALMSCRGLCRRVERSAAGVAHARRMPETACAAGAALLSTFAVILVKD